MKARRLLLTAAAAALFVPGTARGQADDLTALQRDLQRALATYRWPSASWGVLVTSLDRGDTLFALNADSALTPASNVKVLTTAAALSGLGPDFRFRSYLATQGEVHGGVLEGDLVLYGTGDPGISDRFYPDKHTVFNLLIDELEARGIHTVTGDLVGDASFLPGPLRPSTWDTKDLNDHFAPAISALSFNGNVVSFRIEASERVGAPPAVHTIPDHAGLEVDNRAVTVSGTPRPRVAILRDHPLDPVRVEGSIRRGSRDVWRQLTVPDPPAFALSVFRAVLEERGIVVRGRDRVVTVPAESIVSGASVTAPRREGPRTRVLARHTSPPLRDYLAEVNKRSNNLYAELIWRTLGRVSQGEGTAEAGRKAVLAELAELNVHTGLTHLVDGSGLSGENRVSPATFVATLAGLAASPLWNEYWYTLPQAGTRRELGRMYRSPAAGNLRAKTGTIERVSALSGVVRSRDGERLAFSILVNGAPSTTRAKRVENTIGIRLASFSRGRGQALAEADVVPDPEAPESETLRYRVRRGDNFSTIANRYRVPLDELLRVNPTVEPRRLRAGQWIVIPTRGQVATGQMPTGL